MSGRLTIPALVALLALSACGSFGDAPTPESVVLPQLDDRQSPAPVATIGEGAIVVALLLPTSAGGSASGLAQSFQNAAQLAMDEVREDNVRIIVRDTAGATEKARSAAETAVVDGAQLILGPVFAPAVSGASDVARAAGVPIIAFSTDAGVAGDGTYLLSFLPRQDATRIVSFASGKDINSFGALVPDNSYGLVMEAAFREAVAAHGGRVVGVERYAPEQIEGAAQRLADRGAVQAVFVPNGGNDPAAAADTLRGRGVNAKLLGSGQWDNPQILAAPVLEGAWYPGPARGGFDGFTERYRNTFGTPPPRTASLVYDAVLLANGLVGTRGSAAFQARSLENRDGYVGVDGVFRLTSRGLSERGLAVYEVGPSGTARIISDAPSALGP